MTGSTCTPGWISRQAILGARPVPVAPFPSGGAVPGGLVILAGDWMDRSGKRTGCRSRLRPRATRGTSLSRGRLFVRVLGSEKPEPR